MLNQQKSVDVEHGYDFRLTPKQAAAFRRNRSGLTLDGVVRAVQQYWYFLDNGGKYPFLHDSKSKIICPVNIEVVSWIFDNFKLPLDFDRRKLGFRHWSRQQLREYRRQYGKYYEPTVVARIVAKREARNNKQLSPTMTQQPKVEVVAETIDDSAEQMSVAVEVDNFIPVDPAIRKVYGDTPVIFKQFGDKITVLVVLNEGRKRAEVYEVNGDILSAKKTSRAQKYNDAELEKYGWKYGNLKDSRFEKILDLMVSLYMQN